MGQRPTLKDQPGPPGLVRLRTWNWLDKGARSDEGALTGREPLQVSTGSAQAGVHFTLSPVPLLGSMVC